MRIIVFILLFFTNVIFAQHRLKIEADLDTINDILNVKQEIFYHNDSQTNLKELYFYAWANSFQKNTPLDKELLTQYSDKLHFAKDSDNGFISQLKLDKKVEQFSFLKKQRDILKIVLKEKLKKGEIVKIKLYYKIKIPSSSFTGYGKTNEGYYLKNNYIIPAIFENSKWIYNSNKGYDDMLLSPTDIELKYKVPKKYALQTNINDLKTFVYNDKKEFFFSGKGLKKIETSIKKQGEFIQFQLNSKTRVVLDFIPVIGFNATIKFMNKHLNFLKEKVGVYQPKKIFITKEQVDKSLFFLFKLPVINSMEFKFLGKKWVTPRIARFKKEFEWNLKLLRLLSYHIIDDKYNINKRDEFWFYKGVVLSLENQYVDKFYPHKKLIGNLASLPLIDLFEVSKLKINEKNRILQLYMERRGYGQSIATPVDSLININKIITAEVKSMLGLKFLKTYVGENIFNQAMNKMAKSKHKITTSKNFANYLNEYSHKNVDWYFHDYIHDYEKLDVNLKSEIKLDSIYLTIKNKPYMPFKITILYNDDTKKISWHKPSEKTLSILKKNVKQIRINEDWIDFNYKDNVAYFENNLVGIGTKWQFKPFIDVEKTNTHQTFIMPEVTINKYDKLMLGLRFTNKTLLLKQNLNYSISTFYSTGQNTLVGSLGTSYQWVSDKKDDFYRLMNIMFGFDYYHYDEDKAYFKYTTSFKIDIKPAYQRDINRSYLYFRLNKLSQYEETIFNAKYVYNQPEKLQQKFLTIDSQLSEYFAKISLEYKYRQKFTKYHNYSLRFFGGGMLFNKEKVGDTFQFNIADANDYLFNYPYFGRLDTDGFFYQQLFIAEGGLKILNRERFKYVFSVGGTISIFDPVELYIDYAVAKKSGAKFNSYYNMGVRLNIVEDLLEVYFPIHSSTETEIISYSYLSKIRYIFTFDLSVILSRFRRGYY